MANYYNLYTGHAADYDSFLKEGGPEGAPLEYWLEAAEMPRQATDIYYWLKPRYELIASFALSEDDFIAWMTSTKRAPSRIRWGEHIRMYEGGEPRLETVAHGYSWKHERLTEAEWWEIVYDSDRHRVHYWHRRD